MYGGCGLYNVGTGIILNDFIANATLQSNPIQHNVFWIAYASVAVLVSVATKGRLGYSPPRTVDDSLNNGQRELGQSVSR
jgi:hypothetical protein